jgi:hypothetical protein
MNTSHAKALQNFARRINLLLAVRAMVQISTIWFFVWGAVVLAFRIFSAPGLIPTALILLASLPLAWIVAGWRIWQQPPSFQKVRATYDRWNGCGGLIMTGETADMTGWQDHLPSAAIPPIRWNNGKALLQLAIALSFAATAVLIPERLAHPGGHRHLEIGSIVDQLQTEIKTLAQEKIIPDRQAEETRKQLSELQKDSAGLNPDKTWEALDQIKEADQTAARQATEEALAKTAALSEAGTMAEAMDHAADAGMSPETATQAAQDLASMINDTKLDDGMMNGSIPPELLANLDKLNKEQLQKLMAAMNFNKGKLGNTISNLANLKLIDAAALSECQKAGKCNNPDALAAYLSHCTNGCSASECLTLCRAGLSRGGPGAPMTWSDGASEQDQKFKEHALPPANHLSDAQLVGVSKTAPKLNDTAVADNSGELTTANAGGGSAHVQSILPEHRQAVQNYFKREN